MQILQVKKYHSQVARQKETEALARWRAKDNGYGYPIKSMFFFLLDDTITERQKGYIAYNKHKAVFGINETEAINNFNK